MTPQAHEGAPSERAERLRERVMYEINVIFADDPDMLVSCRGIAIDVLAAIVEELEISWETVAHYEQDPCPTCARVRDVLATLLSAAKPSASRSRNATARSPRAVVRKRSSPCDLPHLEQRPPRSRDNPVIHTPGARVTPKGREGGRRGSEDGGATISDCGTYRYELWRNWRDDVRVNFVMLNPSTADAIQDDPTIRRCVGFAKGWGFGGMVVTNLYALRATDPREVAKHGAPIGPDNDTYLFTRAATSALVVLAWGVHGGPRGDTVATMLRVFRPGCIGRTKTGHPRHPLYLPRTASCEPFFAAPTPETAVASERGTDWYDRNIRPRCNICGRLAGWDDVQRHWWLRCTSWTPEGYEHE